MDAPTHLIDKEAPRELELKLEIAPGEVERLLRHPLLARAAPLPDQGGHFHAVYYDTEDQSLRRAGLSLRIRLQNGRHIQTVKAAGRSRGVTLDRGEWETPVAGELDLDAVRDTPLAPFIADVAERGKIRPAFTVETERAAFELRRDGAVVEIALDRAEASAGDRSMRFAEVEVELKEGPPEVLFAIARDLADAAPLRLAPITKSERGYGLLTGPAVEAIRADKIELPPEASCAEAFQIIARSCLSQIVANEAGLRRTREAEALHQLRVGLRRLRAAMSLFKDMLSGGETNAVKDELRWVGQTLGPARDLDVLLDSLHGSSTSGWDEGQWKEVEERRSEAYGTLLSALDSPRFMGAILKTAAWVEIGDWLTEEEASSRSARLRPVRDHATTELSRRFRRIRRLAKHIADFNDEGRHELRIRIKKLRYGVEFFGTLFARGAKSRRKALLAILERLQDVLGEMNDIAVGSALIPSSPADQDPARAEKRLRKLLSKAESASRKLSKTQPFWL